MNDDIFMTLHRDFAGNDCGFLLFLTRSKVLVVPFDLSIDFYECLLHYDVLS